MWRFIAATYIRATMFKGIDESFAAIAKWAADYPVLGFLVMGWTGGLVAVLLAYQKVGVEFTWRTFLARCVAKSVIGIFLAGLVFFAWRSAGLASDWGFIVAGICGLGGSDVAEALVVIFIDWLKRRAGTFIPSNPPTRGTPGDER